MASFMFIGAVRVHFAQLYVTKQLVTNATLRVRRQATVHFTRPDKSVTVWNLGAGFA
jgi:hypothetical protein